MIFLLFLLDLFFYTYTSIATCFFLLAFLFEKQSFFEITILGLFFDIYIVHTNGLFLLFLLLSTIISKKIKGLYFNRWNSYVFFFLLAFCFLVYTHIFFSKNSIYFFGLFLDFLLFVSTKIFLSYIK